MRNPLVLVVGIVCLIHYSPNVASQSTPTTVAPLTSTSPSNSTTSVAPVTTTKPTPPSPVTTVAPTTVAPTTVAPTPKPTPGFDQHVYNLTDSAKNISCLEAKFALQFNLTGTIVNVTDALVTNNCPEDGNLNTTLLPLELKFTKEKEYHVTLRFVRDLKDNKTSLANVTLDILVSPPTRYTFDQTMFQAEGLKGYRCKERTGITAVNNTDVHITFKDVEIKHPFHFGGELVDSEYVCSADDDMDDKIPLAVGAALIFLVLIVIISYYVGVRRSRRLTYQSV